MLSAGWAVGMKRDQTRQDHLVPALLVVAFESNFEQEHCQSYLIVPPPVSRVSKS
jgi:hypothetical protein